MTTGTLPVHHPRRVQRRRTERLLAVAAIILIGIAWVVGAWRAEADLLASIRRALPQADHFERIDEGVYAAWADRAGEELLGYVAVGTANGYGGPLELAVAVDLEGHITGLHVVNHKETHNWFARVTAADFLDTLIGKPYSDSFALGEDIDAVTGATMTSRALAAAALDGSHAAARALGMDVTDPKAPEIQFGIPEVAVLALFAVGYIGHRRGFKYKTQVRWASMLSGLLILGFLYNIPITLAYFAKLILGYWPPWQTSLYWYFLIGGILFVVTADNKNPYCEWFCPFGAAQECMGLIGGARPINMGRYRDWLRWAQRLLALAAILLGVFFRNPGLASFEIFGVLFNFFGPTRLVIVLALVLALALFVKRPWCNFLCPIHPVVEFIRIMRQWIIELWQKLIPGKKTVQNS